MARPVSFSREEVLEKAMGAFWERGYSVTGISDLVKVTGLNPGSLYGAFKSKEDLFLAALDLYGERSIAQIEKALREKESPLEAIRCYFHRLARDSAGLQARRSCLLVNTVLEMGRSNPRIQRRVNKHLRRIEALFRRALEEAKARGELSSDKNPAAIASSLMVVIWGLRVLGGTAPQQSRTSLAVLELLSVLDK